MVSAEKPAGKADSPAGSISAECGLAWCTEIEQKRTVEQAAKEGAIQIQGIHEVMLYERK